MTDSENDSHQVITPTESKQSVRSPYRFSNRKKNENNPYPGAQRKSKMAPQKVYNNVYGTTQTNATFPMQFQKAVEEMDDASRQPY